MRIVFGIALVALVSMSAAAQSTDAPSPPLDVVDLATGIFLPTAQPNGGNEGVCTVTNATSGPVKARLRAEVVYADGQVSRLTGNFDPGPLEAGAGFELSIFFFIPPETALGTATFRCEVQAQSLDAHGKPEVESGAASFEVLAP